MNREATTVDLKLREIVLIEDERADAMLIERALRKAGVTNPLKVLSDGERALEYLTRPSRAPGTGPRPMPGLILLDIKLPRIDGLTVLRHIKATAGLRRVPVVVLSSSAQPRDVRAAYDLGANSYLVKPSRFAELCDLAGRLHDYWLALNTPADQVVS